MARPKEFKVDAALQKATEAFWERGFEGTSLADLTATMGIQKASLYDTFGDKHHLFIAALKQYQAAGLERFREAFESETDPARALENMLRVAIPQGDSCENRRGCLSVNATVELGPHDCEVAKLLEDHSKQVLDLVAECVCKGQAMGQFRLDIAPTAAAKFIVTTFYGLSVVGKIEPDPAQLEAVVELVVKALRK